MLIVRAPVRISLGGGGTDFEAYYSKYGGVVVSAAIARYAYVVIVPEELDRVEIVTARCASFSQIGPNGHLLDDSLALPRAALRQFGLRRGLRLLLSSEVPSGTGLGSSSSLAVALTAGLSTLLGTELTREQVAELACDLEIRRLGMPIGRQDQYAAAFGGLNVITFEDEGVTVERLAISPANREELQRRLMLFFTGTSRLSSTILRRQRQRTVASAPDIIDSLHAIKEMALEMRQALEHGELDQVGKLLDLSWQRKKQLAPGISNSFLDECYWLSRASGAVGGKITGAGGGGFLLIYCPPEHQQRVADVLKAKGLVRMDLAFETGGFQVMLNNARVDLAALRDGGGALENVAADVDVPLDGHPDGRAANGRLLRAFSRRAGNGAGRLVPILGASQRDR